MRSGSTIARDLAAPPNLVSLARLALVPVALGLIAAGHRGLAVGALAVMVLTDGLDGYLARRLSRITEIGKILDPAADKVAVDSVLALLAARGEFPPWALAVVVGRDAAIVAGALWLRRRVRAVPAAIGIGKFTLVVLAAMTIAYVADAETVEPWLLWAGMAAAAASGAAYAAVAVRARRGRLGVSGGVAGEGGGKERA